MDTPDLLPFLLHHEIEGRGPSDTPLHLVRIAMNEDDALKGQFDESMNKKIHSHFGQVLESELAKRPELGAILYRGHGSNGACFLLLPNTPTQQVKPLLEDLQGALAQRPAPPDEVPGISIPLSFSAGIAAHPLDASQAPRSREDVEQLCGALITEAHGNMRQIESPVSKGSSRLFTASNGKVYDLDPSKWTHGDDWFY